MSYAGYAGYASSVSSTTGTIAGYARKMAHNSKPDMEILLQDHYDGKIYSTFDPICGRVEITAPQNARFDEVQIAFEGISKVYVENLSPAATRSKITAVHKFLKLSMPIRDSEYPQPRIAESGQTYKFDFNFAVPKHLLPRACAHKCSTEHVHTAHTQVPPSMGDRDVSIMDDLAPDMGKIQYAVTVRVVGHKERDGKEVVLVEGQKKINVVPATQEAAPLGLGRGDEDYVVSKTKFLKKGVFSGKLGRITVSAPQPSALVLPAPASGCASSPTTMATVNLRFDPHDAASQPPRLGGLSTKIKASTFYAARPAPTVPSHFTMLRQFETTRGVYDVSTSLSSRCVESVTWEKHEPRQAVERRNSDSSTSSSDYSDNALTPEQKPGNPFYTASVLVPITLPSNKAWIPTFHSCILSRVYAIDLSLVVHTPGTGVPATSITLHLPIQIASNSNRTQQAELTPAEAAEELASAHAYIQPRILEVPDEEHIGHSVLASTPSIPSAAPELPPSYEDFHAQARAEVLV